MRARLALLVSVPPEAEQMRQGKGAMVIAVAVVRVVWRCG